MQLNTSLSKKIYSHIFISVSFAISLVFFRMKITQSEFYIFLIWNLFLAGIPYVITQAMKNYIWLQSSNIASLLCFSTWLLFLPNSPYIITDIIHLQNNNSLLAWYDLLLVFVFAINGLVLGLLSMVDMCQMISFKFSTRMAFFSMLKICLLTGYGIYLGRFLRFNSWDIIRQPKFLWQQIIESSQDPKAYFITFAFGGFLWILFSLLHVVFQLPKKSYHRL